MPLGAPFGRDFIPRCRSRPEGRSYKYGSNISAVGAKCTRRAMNPLRARIEHHRLACARRAAQPYSTDRSPAPASSNSEQWRRAVPAIAPEDPARQRPHHLAIRGLRCRARSVSPRRQRICMRDRERGPRYEVVGIHTGWRYRSMPRGNRNWPWRRARKTAAMREKRGASRRVVPASDAARSPRAPRAAAAAANRRCSPPAQARAATSRSSGSRDSRQLHAGQPNATNARGFDARTGDATARTGRAGRSRTARPRARQRAACRRNRSRFHASTGGALGRSRRGPHDAPAVGVQAIDQRRADLAARSPNTSCGFHAARFTARR